MSRAGEKERSETGRQSECYLEKNWKGLCKSVFTISYCAAPRSARKYWASPGGGCWGPAPISLHFLEGIFCSTP